MREYYPLLLVGGILGFISIVLIIAFASIKDKKQSIGFDRHMKDSEIVKRLLRYAKPYVGSFILVFFIMLVGIAYDIVSPLILGKATKLISAESGFELPRLYTLVAIYAGILVVSMICTYAQAIILQRVGQKIISGMREDLFTHIEELSHEQMNSIPVGKLVTRVTNDTNAISLMFTSLLVNLLKNVFIIVGVLVAMLALNFELTLMVLCFVPFILLFTIIFRKFARRAYRRVKDRTTDINTYLSENLSGIKITQIFNREGEKQRDFEEKSRGLGKAKGEQILAGLHALYQLRALPVLSWRQGRAVGRQLPRADHRSGDHRQLLYVHQQVLQPDPEPCGAVQLAAVGVRLGGEGLLDNGYRARARRRARRDRA